MKTSTMIIACIALALVYLLQVAKFTESENEQAQRMKLYQAKTDKPLPSARSYLAKATNKEAVKQAIVAVGGKVS